MALPLIPFTGDTTPSLSDLDANFAAIDEKVSESVSVEDFGALGYPASTDDSAAIILALASGAKKVRMTRPKYRTTQDIQIPTMVALVGCGGLDPTSSGAGTQIIKASTMTGNAVTLAGNGAQLVDVAVVGETGNTGDGVQVIAGRCTLRRVAGNKMGGDGIRIGADDAPHFICNLWYAEQLITRENGGHGVYIHGIDLGGGPSVNGGVLNGLDTAANGGDGIRSNQAWLNTLSGVCAQTNTGYGVNFTSLSRWNTLVGGDQNEANVAGQINDDGLANVMLGASYTGVTSAGATWPVRINRDALMWNLTVASLLKASNSSGTTPYPLVSENIGNVANGRGAGILLRPPNGSGTARDGAQIASEQETTNKDYLRWSVNISGVMTEMLRLSPNFLSIVPGADNTYSLGRAALRYSNIVAVNATLTPPASVTPANNGEVMFQLTSNTSLTFKVKGSDGVVRSASLTLA